MESSNKTNRIEKLQAILAQKKINAAILTFSRDILYYTGTAQPCLLVVTPDNYQLLVRRAYDFVMHETFIKKEKIVDKGSFKSALEYLHYMSIKKGRLGLTLDVITADFYLKTKRIFNEFDLTNISNDVLLQRMQKDNEEIAAIQQACKIMHAGHERVLETLHPGMTELQLAAEVEYAHRNAGHEGILSMRNLDFYISRGPLSSGKNLFKVSGFANTITGLGLSPAVPAGPSRTQINKGDLVIVDIPTCYNGYHCDQTRTYFLGTPSNAVNDLFQKLNEIYNKAILTLKDGVSCNELFEATSSMAKKLGVLEYFLGLDPRKGNFIGHGIGLDANESPIIFQGSDFNLLKNFVLTIEIHLTHPTLGAVKLEDVVLVKENNCEILTITPRELFSVN